MSLDLMSERILAEFFGATNARDFSFIPNLYASHALIHTLNGKKQGSEVILDIFRKWMHAFPDFHIKPLAACQEDDVTVVHWRATGTFTHQLNDIPPTGKKTTIHGLTCFKSFKNQIIEHWARVDYRPLEG